MGKTGTENLQPDTEKNKQVPPAEASTDEPGKGSQSELSPENFKVLLNDSGFVDALLKDERVNQYIDSRAQAKADSQVAGVRGFQEQYGDTLKKVAEAAAKNPENPGSAVTGVLTEMMLQDYLGSGKLPAPVPGQENLQPNLDPAPTTGQVMGADVLGQVQPMLAIWGPDVAEAIKSDLQTRVFPNTATAMLHVGTMLNRATVGANQDDDPDPPLERQNQMKTLDKDTKAELTQQYNKRKAELQGSGNHEAFARLKAEFREKGLNV